MAYDKEAYADRVKKMQAARESQGNRTAANKGKQYTPGFIEMAVNYITTKTPADAAKDVADYLGRGHSYTKNKRKENKAKQTSKKTTVSDAQKTSSQVRKKADTFRDIDKPNLSKNYNVGVSKGGVPFKEAFAHFRKKGAKTFEWNGKKYTTELAKPKGKK